jgi:hypothetical protein
MDGVTKNPELDEGTGGYIRYLDSGEVVTYDNTDEFMKELKNALHCGGPLRVKAEGFDDHTKYEIYKAFSHEFGVYVEPEGQWLLSKTDPALNAKLKEIFDYEHLESPFPDDPPQAFYAMQVSDPLTTWLPEQTLKVVVRSNAPDPSVIEKLVSDRLAFVRHEKVMAEHEIRRRFEEITGLDYRAYISQWESMMNDGNGFDPEAQGCEFNLEQLETIEAELRSEDSFGGIIGRRFREITGFSYESFCNERNAMYNSGIDFDPKAQGCEFDFDQLEQVEAGLTSGIDVSRYTRPEHGAELIRATLDFSEAKTKFEVATGVQAETLFDYYDPPLIYEKDLAKAAIDQSGYTPEKFLDIWRGIEQEYEFDLKRMKPIGVERTETPSPGDPRRKKSTVSVKDKLAMNQKAVDAKAATARAPGKGMDR